MLQELDQGERVHNRILVVINILQQVRVRSPGHVPHVLIVLLRGVIPDIPLVEGQIDVPVAVLCRLHVVTGRNNGIDEIIKIVACREEVRRVVRIVVPILMQRDVIHVIIGFIEDTGLPLSERRHIHIGGTADHRLDGIVHRLHRLGGLRREMPVLPRLLVPGLPGSIHLIAHAPQLDAVRILVPVLFAEIRIVGIGIEIAVFQQIEGIRHPARPQIHRHHDIRAGFLRPLGKLVDPDFIRLIRPPGQVQSRPALRLRSHGILPAEVRDKISTRIPHNRHAKLLHQLNHILAESVLVRGRVSGLIDTRVYRSSKMLDERPVDPLVHLSDPEILVHNQLCLVHKCLIPLPSFSMKFVLSCF